MTPGQYLALARDLLVLCALGFLIWLGWHLKDAQDTKALARQIEANAKTTAQWQKESSDAGIKRDQEIASVRDLIAAQRQPIIVQVPPRPVPSPTAAPGGTPAAAGRPDEGPRCGTCDVRGAINVVEDRYETALADCRAVLASWPK